VAKHGDTGGCSFDENVMKENRTALLAHESSNYLCIMLCTHQNKELELHCFFAAVNSARCQTRAAKVLVAELLSAHDVLDGSHWVDLLYLTHQSAQCLIVLKL
jgi:hypothetical protein